MAKNRESNRQLVQQLTSEIYFAIYIEFLRSLIFVERTHTHAHSRLFLVGIPITIYLVELSVHNR